MRKSNSHYFVETVHVYLLGGYNIYIYIHSISSHVIYIVTQKQVHKNASPGTPVTSRRQLPFGRRPPFCSEKTANSFRICTGLWQNPQVFFKRKVSKDLRNEHFRSNGCLKVFGHLQFREKKTAGRLFFNIVNIIIIVTTLIVMCSVSNFPLRQLLVSVFKLFDF